MRIRLKRYRIRITPPLREFESIIVLWFSIYTLDTGRIVAHLKGGNIKKGTHCTIMRYHLSREGNLYFQHVVDDEVGRCEEEVTR